MSLGASRSRTQPWARNSYDNESFLILKQARAFGRFVDARIHVLSEVHRDINNWVCGCLDFLFGDADGLRLRFVLLQLLRSPSVGVHVFLLGLPSKVVVDTAQISNLHTSPASASLNTSGPVAFYSSKLM